MKNWTLLLISFTLYSCVSDDPIVDYLCGKSGVIYWDIYNPNERTPVGAYRFEKDGSCYYLAYHYETEPPYSIYRHVFSWTDVIKPNCWQEVDTNQICLNGFERKIIEISPSKFKIFSSIDTIRDKAGDIALLDSLFIYYVKSTDQRDDIDFDSLKKANNFYFSVKNNCCNEQ